MADEQLTPEQERGVLAGEYALSVLEGEELAAARRLLLSDPDFAAQVQWWYAELGVLADEAAGIAPSDGVWARIEERLASGASTTHTVERLPARGLHGPGLLAALAAAAAAAAAITLLLVNPTTGPTAPVPTAPSTQGEQATRYVAQAQSEDGSISLAGIVDPANESLRIRVDGLAPSQGQVAELWAVPEGGAPRSLGSIPADGTVSIALDDAQRGDLGAGSALAVTYEDGGGVPHEAPTSTILIVGPLTQL